MFERRGYIQGGGVDFGGVAHRCFYGVFRMELHYG